LISKIDTAKINLQEIIVETKEISSKQQLLEKTVKTLEVKHNTSHTEAVTKIKSMEIDILQEAEYIAKNHCEKRANASSSSDCCADCTKPNIRVPSKIQCNAHGCSHGCVYHSGACDAKGKKMGHCTFPFEYKGEKYSSCVNLSPFGTTKRPWCKVGDKVAFCDCPAVECTCPPGGVLSADGKSCTGVPPPLKDTPTPAPEPDLTITGGDTPKTTPEPDVTITGGDTPETTPEPDVTITGGDTPKTTAAPDVEITGGDKTNKTVTQHFKNKTESSSHHTNKTTTHSKSKNATHVKVTNTSKTVTVTKKTTHSVEITHTVTISSTTQLEKLVHILKSDMTVSKNITIEGVQLHKGDELIDALTLKLLKSAIVPLDLHFGRTEGCKEVKGKKANTKALVTSQKVVTLKSFKIVGDIVEHIGHTDLKLSKSLTVDGWILEPGDELLNVTNIGHLFEVELPAKLTFQRSGTTVKPWMKASGGKKTVKSRVVVTRIINIYNEQMLEAVVDELDQTWKVTRNVDKDGVVLDKGDILLQEGSMAKAETLEEIWDLADHLSKEEPAKLVFRKAKWVPGDEVASLDEEGHVVETEGMEDDDEIPEGVKEDFPDDMPEGVKEDFPDDMPEGVKEDFPDDMPEGEPTFEEQRGDEPPAPNLLVSPMNKHHGCTKKIMDGRNILD